MATREPPKAEIMKPAITAVKIPASGFTPDAIAKAIANGRATIPTVMPAIKSAKKFCAEYPFSASTNFGRNGMDFQKDMISKRQREQIVERYGLISMFFRHASFRRGRSRGAFGAVRGACSRFSGPTDYQQRQQADRAPYASRGIMRLGLFFSAIDRKSPARGQQSGEQWIRTTFFHNS